MTENCLNLNRKERRCIMFIKGKIHKNPPIQGKQFTIVYFEVDELMKNNTPHTNFWTFCLLNNLIMQWKVENDGDDKFYPTIDVVDLTLSEDEEKNRIVKEMFKKLDINAI